MHSTTSRCAAHSTSSRLTSTRTRPSRRRWAGRSTGRRFSPSLPPRSRSSTARWDRRSSRDRTRIRRSSRTSATNSRSRSSRMPSETRQAEPRLSRWEIVGAWLHVWTPAKGAEVPPIPWRKLAAWGTLGLIVLGAAAAIAVPKIDSGKKKGAAQRARDALAADNAERARLRADQLLHRAAAPAGTSLVSALEGAITRDAKARARSKTLDGPVLATKCEPASANVVQFPRSRVYKCFVRTATGLPGEGKDVIGTGYPFVATIYTTQRKLAWCKENPHADEKGSRGDVRVKLSAVCAGKLTQVL